LQVQRNFPNIYHSIWIDAIAHRYGTTYRYRATLRATLPNRMKPIICAPNLSSRFIREHDLERCACAHKKASLIVQLPLHNRYSRYVVCAPIQLATVHNARASNNTHPPTIIVFATGCSLPVRYHIAHTRLFTVLAFLPHSLIGRHHTARHSPLAIILHPLHALVAHPPPHVVAPIAPMHPPHLSPIARCPLPGLPSPRRHLSLQLSPSLTQPSTVNLQS
jgi:hypothetical protein